MFEALFFTAPTHFLIRDLLPELELELFFSAIPVVFLSPSESKRQFALKIETTLRRAYILKELSKLAEKCSMTSNFALNSGKSGSKIEEIVVA